MGPHKDAASGPNRTPFRLTPDEFAEVLYDWDCHDPTDSPDIPDCDAFRLVPFTDTTDGNVRIDFDDSWAGSLRRLTGYICSINSVRLGPNSGVCVPHRFFSSTHPAWARGFTCRDDTTAENTGTPYRIEVVVKIPFRANVHADLDRLNPDAKSFIWARVRAFTSNALVARGTVIRLGTFVSGIGVACYNGSNRAHLDVWTVTDCLEWRYTAWDTLIESHEVDIWGHLLGLSPGIAQVGQCNGCLTLCIKGFEGVTWYPLPSIIIDEWANGYQGRVIISRLPFLINPAPGVRRTDVCA